MDKEQLQEVRDSIRHYHSLKEEYKRLTEKLKDASTNELSLSSLANGSMNLVDTNIHKAKARHEKILNEVVSIYIYAVNEHQDMRDVAILTCYIDGMNVKETAEHLNVSRKTVYGSLNKIIRAYYNNSQAVTH